MKATIRPMPAARILLILTFVFLLVACGRTRTDAPTPQSAAQEPVSTPASTPDSTTAPTTTDTPDDAPETPTTAPEAEPDTAPVTETQTGPGEQSLPPEAKGDAFATEFSSPDGGFTLPLPDGWTILGSEETPLGVQLLIGPESLPADDPNVSRLIYADVSEVTVESAVEALCDGNCDPLPQPEAFTLGERPAWRVTIPGDAPREWVFVDNGDVIVFFSILDPETQTMREDVVQAMRFSPVMSQAAQSEEIAMVVRQQVVQERGLSADQVVIESVEAVEWPNSCLGAAAADEMCAEVITPGFRVIVDAGGEELVYHTDSTGQQIRLATRQE